MPARSKVYELPPALREELNARLVGSGFGDYVELSEWLAAQGHQISKSALHRYGEDLQAEFESAMHDVKKATELARAYVAGDADEQAALVDASARIAQETILRILIDLRKAENEPQKAAKYVAQVSRALADLGRISIAQKKWAAELRERIASTVEDTARAQGMDEDQVRFWREKVLGVA